jgi:MFS family permease
MQKSGQALSKNIFLLGIVSMFVDISSEMIFSVFAVFFTTILGASTALLGAIEGLADFSSSSLDYVAGYLSDKTGKRKSLAIFGYSFSALAKCLLLIPNSVLFVSIFRVTERLGKSFRGPPRDAWLASLATESNKGFAFGVHKAFDKTGAVLGPLIAYWLLSSFGQSRDTFTLLFKIALVPALFAIILLTFIPEKPTKPLEHENIFKSYALFHPRYKHYLKTAAIFSLAYFSFGFLLLRAYIAGFSITDITLLFASFNLSTVIIAPLAGKLGDRIGRRHIIILGYLIYFLMCLGFLIATTKFQILLLFLLFGVFYAIDESQSKAYISDMEKERVGTAIGFYNFAVGIVYLPASVIAGTLWKSDPNYAFIFAAVISVISLFYFLFHKE